MLLLPADVILFFFNAGPVYLMFFSLFCRCRCYCKYRAASSYLLPDLHEIGDRIWPCLTTSIQPRVLWVGIVNALVFCSFGCVPIGPSIHVKPC